MIIKQVMLVRHAQSKHNQAASEIKVKNPGQNIQISSEYQSLRKSGSFMDSSISEFGVQQCKEVKQKMKSTNVDIVITSPMRRCLETTMELFGDNPNIQIIAEPLLTERINASCDIGGYIVESIDKYRKKIDFSRIPSPDRDSWQLKYIVPQYKSFAIQKQNEDTKDIHKALLKVLQKEEIETIEDCMHRVKILKVEIKRILEKYKGKRVCFVSHGYILRMLTATSFYENGEPVNEVAFQNCEIRTVPIILQENQSTGAGIPLCGC